MAILNLSRIRLNAELIDAGVIDLKPYHRRKLLSSVSFPEPPQGPQELVVRANEVSELASEYEVKDVLIGGIPFFMPILSAVLQGDGYGVWFQFSDKIRSPAGSDYIFRTLVECPSLV